MNFNTSNENFRKLLGNGVNYKVPPFQRNYSWEIEHWDDLWQDMLELFKEKGEPKHYMGYLVLQTSDDKSYTIIDGQQRLATFSIAVLAALANLQELVDEGIDAEKNKNRGEILRNSYIGYMDPVSLISQTKLELNRHNNKFYQNYLVPLEKIPQRNLNKSEHLLRKAFGWFRKKIKEEYNNNGQSIADFIDTLVDGLFFTVITVSDELNAFKVFETLNARGVRLSSTDLLKNYLFSILSLEELHEIEMQKLEDTWERITNELKNASFPEFLRVYWNSRNKLVRKSELFKTMRKNIKKRKEAHALLQNLDRTTSIYVALRSPIDTMWEKSEEKNLQLLKMFNISQPIPLLLQCFEKFSEKNRPIFSKILKAITVISFRYNVIGGRNPNEQERVYNDAAFKISKGELSNAKEILSALNPIYVGDEQFKADFSKKEAKVSDSRNNKIVRYILLNIEKKLSQVSHNSEDTSFSIEHILPENASKEWKHINEYSQKNFIYRLGNMTLLETSLNRDIGNKAYSEKIKKYEESKFQETRDLVEYYYDEWNEAKIETRQDFFAKEACHIWRIDFS